MFVWKRDGRKERVQFDKITARVSRLCYGLDAEHVDAAAITQKVISGVYQGVTTIELDNLAAETAAYMTVTHPDYAILAARIAVSNLHKQTKKQFSSVVDDLYHYINPKNHKSAPMISQYVHKIVMQHAEELNSAIVYDRDFNYQYFGFKTLERSYLLRLNGKVAERPQHMIMRVAVGIHGEDIEKAIETYHLMSQKCFTHASPTLFNAGTPQPQLASCFLIDMKEDSIEGIYDTLKTCALISKTAGGIGLNIHRIRATGSYISGTNGSSNGIVPMLRVFNNTARYVDQGGNKRPGAFAMYLEPWHADVFEFLDLRKNHGKEEVRARDLFLALWIPDLFMKRVEKNGDWTLMCPNEAPGLADVYGDEFEVLYEKYEKEGRGRKTIKAQKLWYSILEAQTETGNPYMLYKDACNRKSNQKNLGTIRSSNLCTEIIEYSAPDEVAVCNLASLALPTFVDSSRGEYDFGRLHDVVQVLTRNLNKIIDINHYPVPEAKKSNMRHRPIGLGVQGLADAFFALRLPFESPEARQLNKQIFETIYHGALTASCQLANELGTYESYPGSPVSQGILQYDMWNVTPSDLWDWDSLKAKIAKNGVRNSLLVAPMPTASTSQILGFNECFEPYTSNIYSRRVLAGEFQVVNPWLLKDLVDMGLWSDNMKNRIIADRGSIQNVPNIPADLKALYKTVWEIPQRTIVQMAADRGAFIDQSQSLNIHLKDPTMGKITSMHFAGWKLGLKTGMYYLRTMAASAPIQFTVDQEQLKVADTNVARIRDTMKKRGGPTGYSSPVQSAVPRPMYVQKPAMNSPPINGMPTPTATPPPVSAEGENKKLVAPPSKESAVLPTFKADIEEGDSPKSLATDPTGEPLKEEGLPEPAVKAGDKDQDEDKDETSAGREEDIYADKVLQCSIENKEACVILSDINVFWLALDETKSIQHIPEAVENSIWQLQPPQALLINLGPIVVNPILANCPLMAQGQGVSEWVTFFTACFRRRIPLDKFAGLLQTFEVEQPGIPSARLVQALIGAGRRDGYIDPRLSGYLEALLALNRVDVGTLLAVAEPSQGDNETISDSTLLDAGDPTKPSLQLVVVQLLTRKIADGIIKEDSELFQFLHKFKAALGRSLTPMINDLSQTNIQLAETIDYWQKQYHLHDELSTESMDLLNGVDLGALSFQDSVLDNDPVNTRAGLYIYLNALVRYRTIYYPKIRKGRF
ncbi:MAG: hypothetical protein Q9201_006830 [Fulgogasparrea decipioides]